MKQKWSETLWAERSRAKRQVSLKFFKLSDQQTNYFTKILAFKLDRLREIQASPRKALKEPRHCPSLREVEARSLKERNTLRQARQGNETIAR